ncbi:MAG: OpgC domain-containing protein [Caldimonas sp.]
MAQLIAFPTPPRAAVAASRGRLWQIDALRGLMLVLMTLTHVPTRFSSPAGQPFGYVSAAEGFVLLSAFMAGWIYTMRHQKRGEPEMRSAFLKRVLKIYLSQAALLLFLFSAVAAIGLLSRQSAITDMVSFYLQHPVEAFVGSLLLVYNPPMLDILPMYILFMLASSTVLIHGMRHGWTGMMTLSIALWLGAQVGLGSALYGAVVSVTGLAIPFTQTGAFEVLAWQLLWMIGLWMGSSYASGTLRNRFPRYVVAAAVVIAAIGFVWRHAVGQAAFPQHPELNVIFDKWQLAPLRLLDLFALMVLAMHFEPWLTRHLPRFRPLEVLGAASMPVFCAHLVIALLALAVLGPSNPERPLGLDVALLVFGFAILYGVAMLSRRIDRHAAQVRAAYEGARPARVNADDQRSPLSRLRSPRR